VVKTMAGIKASLEKELDKKWSQYVRERDSVCQKCGGTGSVSAHHAFGRRHRATRWDVTNGVGLCYPCHIHWAHRDPCGFSDWFLHHIGKKKYEALAKKHQEVVKHSTEDLKKILDEM